MKPTSSWRTLYIPLVLALAAGVSVGVSLMSCGGRDSDRVRVDLGNRLKKLSDTQDAFAGVAALAQEWVVSITVRESRRPRNFLDLFFTPPEQVKGGSGVVVEPSGWILTNRHVVEGATSLDVVFADGSQYKGVRYKAARDTDIAFVKINGGPFETAPIGDSDEVRVGDWAIAVGSPFSFDQTVTVGVISAKGRKISQGRGGSYETFLQTDAAINAGNSGGPLLNLRGEVIGINTAIFSPTRTYAGIGFAIPINRAERLFRHLDKEVVPASADNPAWLGVSVRDLLEEEQVQLGVEGGLVVLQVTPRSPASRAGLREFDILLGVDGAPVWTRSDLIDILEEKEPGEEVALKFLRDRTIVEVECRLGKRE